MKNTNRFKWSQECDEAFDRIQDYLLSSKMLLKPVRGENLFVYLGVSDHAVSVVLISERDGGSSIIYYVSKKIDLCGEKVFEVREIGFGIGDSCKGNETLFLRAFNYSLNFISLKKCVAKP